MLLRRLRWIIGFNHHKISSSPPPPPSSASSSPKRLANAAKPILLQPGQSPPHQKLKEHPMSEFEALHEVAIYIHRFHNLDLFQQGWYQIKITMRWEEGGNSSIATPSRVVQYDAPDLGSNDVCGVWRIDDTDHSFSTHPFRIKYARQDVLLSVMISFNLSLDKYEGLSTSAVILKFELMHAPVFANGLQASPDAYSAAIHEFRIPPKALLGLHSYCPVHFDAFHAVLVDVTVHITLLKGGVHTSQPKVTSGHTAVKDVPGENLYKSKKEGNVTPYRKSEPVPEANDDPVKVVVADSLQDMVFNSGRNVLLEFYAPWCGHCKKLAPILDEVAASFQNDADVVIAKIDGTANDIPSDVFDVKGYPTLYFRSASGNLLLYEGDRTKEDMIEFVNKNRDKTTKQDPRKDEL